MERITPPDKVRHVPSLDGLRFVAVMAVLACHGGVPVLGAMAWLGVDLFFVLSGFLITTLLLVEYERRGRIRLDLFLGRRFLRLMPAYYLYAGFITLAIYAFHWGRVYPGRVSGWSIDDLVRSIWLYCVNYAPPGTDLWERSDSILHLWSLAVEEQFYLIWPPLLALSLRAGRVERLAWALVAAIAINRMSYPDGFAARQRLDSRGLGIMLGCAVAVSLRLRGVESARRALDSTRLRLAAIGAIAALYAACTAVLLQELGSLYDIFRYAVPAFDVLFAVVIASCYYGRGDAITRLLSLRPVVYIGKISYGIYLYHVICQYVTWHVLLDGIGHWPAALRYALRFSTFVALSVGVASLSYYALERPLLALKDRLR